MKVGLITKVFKFAYPIVHDQSKWLVSCRGEFYEVSCNKNGYKAIKPSNPYITITAKSLQSLRVKIELL